MTNDKKNKNDQSDREFAELLREREDNGRIDESLKAIYADDLNTGSASGKPKNNALQKREISLSTKISFAFLLLLFLVTAISWVGFWLLNSGSRLNVNDIELTMAGPVKVIAGQEQVYEILYKNLSGFNLDDAQIYLEAPQNFIITDAVPALASSSQNNMWLMSQIASKRSGRLSVKAKTIGSTDSEINLKATIKYRPENFSSTFDQTAEFTLKIASTGINAEVEMPSFFNLNEAGDFKIKYLKEKESYIDKFFVILEHGDGFDIIGDNQTGIWAIENIPQTQTVLAIKGKYIRKPEVGNKLSVKLAVEREVEVSVKNGDEISVVMQKIYLPFYETEVSPTVIEGALSLTLAVNSSTGDKPVNFSDTLNYVIHYKNTSKVDLKNVIIIMAIINSALIDWSTLNDQTGVERKDNTLIWTKSEVGDLAEISAGSEGNFSFAIKLKNKVAAVNMALNDLAIKTYLDYSIDGSVVSPENHVAEIVNPINSSVDFSTELRYFDPNGQTVGFGPLPPKVGEKTTYQATWVLKNPLRDLREVQVSTVLPAQVNWEKNAVAVGGSILYNESTHEVVWNTENIDVMGEPAFAQFNVSITPVAADQNKILTILNTSRAQARDSETKGIIVYESNAKTSNLDDDLIGKGNGRVE